MAQVFHKQDMPFAYGKYLDDKNKVKGDDGKNRIQTVIEVLGKDFEYIKIAQRLKKIEFRGEAKQAFEKRKDVMGRIAIVKARKAAERASEKKEEEPDVEEPDNDGQETGGQETGGQDMTQEEADKLVAAYTKALEEKKTADEDVTPQEEKVNALRAKLEPAKEKVDAFGVKKGTKKKDLPEGYEEAVKELESIEDEIKAEEGTLKALIKIADEKATALEEAKEAAGDLIDKEEE